MTNEIKTQTLGPVASSTTLALDKAGNDFTKVVTQLQKTIEAVNSLPASVEEMLHTIAATEARVAEVQQGEAEALRTAKRDLEDAIRTNEDEVLRNLLSDRGLTSIQVTELNSLRNELDDAVNSRDDAVNSATNALRNALNTQHESAMAMAELRHEGATAQITAELDNARNTIRNLENQVSRLEESIRDEREARIKIACANSEKPMQINVEK